MQKLTKTEKNAFKNISTEEKAKVLFHYLCQNNAKVEDVVRRIYGDDDTQELYDKVSLVLSFYGFDEPEVGKLGSLGVGYDDVLALVNEHPGGTKNDGGKTTRLELMRLKTKRRFETGELGVK